ncbi:MAG TPA: dienelactone hydrolase family protein [Gammaproteobacteria bacterium]|nr:dienelactone hydrolase family protein [Gammaproteobacteria bacterium]
MPAPGDYQAKEADGLKYREYRSADTGTDRRVAIITDIFGCNEFYQSFATYLAQRGWHALLIDLFSDLGELPEVTREAAFERRHKLRDGKICDSLQAFVKNRKVDAVIGFCLGGNYIFELANRNVDARLVAFYPFPAGLPNQDELTPAFEYLDQLERHVTVLAGGQDDSAGRDNMVRLAEEALAVPALEVHLYQKSGHGFLAQLDSNDETQRRNAEDALAVCLKAIEG